MMAKQVHGLTLALATAALVLGMASATVAQRLSEALIFFELNDTDGDLGIHASIDGEPWTDLRIDGPNGQLLEIFSRGRLRTQGMTQLAFESAEPPFDELRPASFFRRFPEGRYRIAARAQEGGTLRGTAMLSHVLAAPPANVQVNGVPAAESCDDPPPTVTRPVTIDWDPVTTSHPSIGRSGPVTISRYQVFVESEGTSKVGIDLPRSRTAFTVPREITDRRGDFKFEIIARTSSGNNTAVESCFRVP